MKTLLAILSTLLISALAQGGDYYNYSPRAEADRSLQRLIDSNNHSDLMNSLQETNKILKQQANQAQFQQLQQRQAQQQQQQYAEPRVKFKQEECDVVNVEDSELIQLVCVRFVETDKDIWKD